MPKLQRSTIIANGSMTTAEFEAVEAFFRVLAPELERFSARHQLLISKFRHDAPSWDLCFEHPCGGPAKLSVGRASDDELQLSGAWWRDVYETFTRHLRMESWPPFAPGAVDLSVELERRLREIAFWSEFTDSRSGYRYPWARYSKQDFEAMTPRFPRLRL